MREEEEKRKKEEEKKYSLKTGYNKKRTSSQLLTEENIFDLKERCNTIINSKIKSKEFNDLNK